MSYLISLPCLSWPMLPRSAKSGLTSTKPRKIKKVTVMQYSDLFWCGRGDSPSRALKTVRRTVFARRDASGGLCTGCGARIGRRPLGGACPLRPRPLLRLPVSAAGGGRLCSCSDPPLAASCTISYKIKRAVSFQMLLLVRPGGFEPLAFGVGVQRSIKLSYDRTFMKIFAGTRFIV